MAKLSKIKLKSNSKIISFLANSSKASSRKAFSLVEISIVILVVGILIAGISQGVDLYAEYRFKVAQNLTQNSVVNRIEDLVAWYETTLPSSFKPKELEIENSNISAWYDNNSLSTAKNNAIAETPLNVANQPILVKNALNNSIPALRFNGAQYLKFDGTQLAQSNYTIFVVEQRRSSKANNYFVAGTDRSTNTNLHIGYRNSNVITIAHYNNDSNYSTLEYSTPLAKVHRFNFNSNVGKSYFLNGKNIAGSGGTLHLQPLTSFNNALIGNYVGSNYYDGDIAEIIIFKRDLSASQDKAVENYLGKKYGIDVN